MYDCVLSGVINLKTTPAKTQNNYIYTSYDVECMYLLI